MPTRRLIEGHRGFQHRFDSERERYLKLAREGQSPQFLWIGCCDSRVVPEHIVGAGPGDLFVVRTVANIVEPPGSGAEALGAAIEYAVLHLKVPHAVVCGHTECGGIRALDAALDPSREPHMVRWIERARPALARPEVRAAAGPDGHLAAVRANTLVQRDNLLAYPCVREAVAAGRLRVHAMLYDLHTGALLLHNDPSCRWAPLEGLFL